jgi:hypothetical protein
LSKTLGYPATFIDTGDLGSRRFADLTCWSRQTVITAVCQNDSTLIKCSFVRSGGKVVARSRVSAFVGKEGFVTHNEKDKDSTAGETRKDRLIPYVSREESERQI